MREWWRIDGWPTPEEWSAAWAFASAGLAAILLYIAWRQLHGLSVSNTRLAESNELLAEANRALARPTVVVELQFERVAWRNYTSPHNESNVYVTVTNVGPSPAADLKLRTNPLFQTTGRKLSDDGLAA